MAKSLKAESSSSSGPNVLLDLAGVLVELLHHPAKVVCVIHVDTATATVIGIALEETTETVTGATIGIGTCVAHVRRQDVETVSALETIGTVATGLKEPNMSGECLPLVEIGVGTTATGSAKGRWTCRL